MPFSLLAREEEGRWVGEGGTGCFSRSLPPSNQSRRVVSCAPNFGRGPSLRGALRSPCSIISTIKKHKSLYSKKPSFSNIFSYDNLGSLNPATSGPPLKTRHCPHPQPYKAQQPLPHLPPPLQKCLSPCSAVVEIYRREAVILIKLFYYSELL